MNNIEIISVHYKTPDYIYTQYNSVRKFYPKIHYRIIDGSDNNVKYFEDLEKNDINFKVNRFGYNIHHGPGMDYAIKSSKFEFLLILDSDVCLKKPLIEDMFKNFKGYATGKKIIVNSDGFESWQKPKTNHNFKYIYIHPYCMLLKKSEYLKFNPFIKHGAPCIQSMIDINKQQKSELLSDFIIEEYVDLKVRGTRKIWGLGL